MARPRVRRGIAELRCSERLCHNVAVLRRGVATVHIMEILCFCLFLLFCYSEYLSNRLRRTIYVYESDHSCCKVKDKLYHTSPPRRSNANKLNAL